MDNKARFTSRWALPGIFSLFIILTGLGSAQAQIRSLPAAVTDSFGVKFPGAKQVSYDDKIMYVLARFTSKDNKKCTARFTSKGQWQWTETAMKFEDLPAAVQDGFNKSKYMDWKVDNVYLINLPAGVVRYRVEAEKSAVQKRNLVFSTKGRLLSDNITM